MFTKEDLQDIKNKGIDIKTVEKQIENFKKGFPFLELIAPVTIDNGIKRLNKTELKSLSEIYKEESVKYNILNFVPASGAATRMFKDLITFRETTDIGDESLSEEVERFFTNLEKFAFYDELKGALEKDGKELNKLIESKEYKVILEYLLSEKGLNYSNLPKALLLFHKYENENRKAYEEHMVETEKYIRNKENKVQIHFTVPDETYNEFKSQADNSKYKFEERFKVKYELTYSQQKPSTDIIAVDLNNNPFRDKRGKIVFRPGGHGALIENLNDCQNDIIFIKNIDNITTDKYKPTTIQYKRALGGVLIHTHQKLAQYLEMLESNDLSDEVLKEIEEFAEKSLNLKIEDDYRKYTKVDKTNYLYFLLNRPLRVCGMVRNSGETGGGPFWVRENNGAVSLQIAETSQIDIENKEQYKILKHSTHFNPVDLVCFVRDYKGVKFNLTEYVDHSTGFISIKSKDGKELKAQELPGLWNGAMSDWITLFYEVPLITFNPVKTVNDLLKPEHESNEQVRLEI